MFSPDLMRYLISHDIEEYEVAQKKQINLNENKIFRYANFATVPIEIKD